MGQRARGRAVDRQAARDGADEVHTLQALRLDDLAHLVVAQFQHLQDAFWTVDGLVGFAHDPAHFGGLGGVF